jgi:hypothetical protein
MASLGIKRSDLTADFFEMIPREAVQSSFFPAGIPQNAIWDFFRTRGDRYFVSLCAEGRVSASGALYEFLPSTLEFKWVFDLATVCQVGPRAIPPSKIHTSMDELADGRLIMLTHTTAPAPGHPAWMLDAYYNHTWEGFAGSHLLIYDPRTGALVNRGIPVPRETLYGGIYDESHDAYYMIGFLRGHVYRYAVATAQLDDLGQVAEWASFRLARGPDRNLYGATRTGWLFKIDVDRVRVVDLNYRLPGAPGLLSRRQFAFAATGPDQRLYIAHHCSDRLVALDPKTLRAEDVGSIDPAPRMAKNSPRCVAGLGWDGGGRLWYGLASHVGGGPGFWTHLASWDVTRGGQPEIRGLIGTAERSAYYISEMIHSDGQLLATDTNHGMDAPGIRIIDLARLDQHRNRAREICRDPFAYAYLDDRLTAAPEGVSEAQMAPYVKLLEEDEAGGRFMAQNPFTLRAERVEVIPLWRSIAAEESGVRSLVWEDEEVLHGVCGTDVPQRFTIRQGRLDCAFSPVEQPLSAPERPAGLPDFALPARPGRQYLAQACCWLEWSGGRWLVGTRDGLLALIDPVRKTVFNLGPVCPQGPVRALCSDVGRTVAFGTAGDEWDLWSCFYYDDRIGVRELGRTFTGDTDPWGSANSCILTAVALSPSGNKLAIGAADRLGTVYVYHRPQIPG